MFLWQVTSGSVILRKQPANFLEKATNMSQLLTIELFKRLKRILQKCIGCAIHESQVSAQKQLGDEFDQVVFLQVHRTLRRMGYLREMGKCSNYAKEVFITYCWDYNPIDQTHYTDLLIVLEINCCLKNSNTEVPGILALCDPT